MTLVDLDLLRSFVIFDGDMAIYKYEF